jgi:hypothetical protein
MTNLKTEPISYLTERLTIELGSSVASFVPRYEAAVPAVPTGRVMEMGDTRSSVGRDGHIHSDSSSVRLSYLR